MLGILFIIGSLLLVILSFIWGIKDIRKNRDQEKQKKYRVPAFLFTIGFILSAGYIVGAKRFNDNMDLTMSWMLLSSGFLISAAGIFAIGHLSQQKNTDES
ncbi:hypothetical protein [Lederbergia galactosidilytica]|uniref:Uncharacterized protein n=1 Tax=Lederbergia galactosidilytica TaxID=217031 RepID=A0A0Q9Y7I0_9BACI|nr:hypothetical protein [Lederbergia galactosidilytica]KRG11656.1 hypothetical protein ACA29_16035 [Lederbergia galactosidilytica]KRG14398.1 hypothetical protein ACA30_11770 [Virgibacillus soli]MBP1916726.1 hypothetical protein [Lederbergia galactosidilytica]OAK70975.1 hypothetical protein ABB05_11325 [Lederbergia galactosidilytica]